MTLDFLSPLAALVGLLVLVPLAAVRLRERRHARVRAAIGLADPGARTRRPVGVALAVLFALLAVAAAQPVLRHSDPVLARTDAEAYVLVDASRSMLASSAPGAETRFDRAVRLGVELGRALPDVPIGVASITDRPLPHLFPTVDRRALDAVLARSVEVGRPPPSETDGPRATELGSLVALAEDNYFSARSARRLVVLLTDGESSPFDPDRVGAALRRAGIDLVVVRLWSASERVYAAGGRVEEAYLPSRSSDAELTRLAGQTEGGRVVSERDFSQAVALARSALGDGPAVEAVERSHLDPLAPWIVLAAALPLAFLLVPPGWLAYCMLAPCRGSWRTAVRRSRGAPAPRPRSSFAPRSSTGASSPGSG